MIEIVDYNCKYAKELYKLYKVAHNKADDHCNLNTGINEYIPNIDQTKVKLLKVDKRFKGYIFFNNSSIISYKDRLNIQEIFIDKYYDTHTNYIALMESANKLFLFKRYKYAQIYLTDNKKSSELVNKLGLTIEKKIFEMKVQIAANFKYYGDISSNAQFMIFRRGIDEADRVTIQNSIFKDTKGHINFNVDDILYEEKQDYYMEDGCIFLVYNNKIVGYSQIILERFPFIKPSIVNFGIDRDFRNLGLSSSLLYYTLDRIRQKGFYNAYLTVDANNKIAYNLYKKVGFKKISTHSCFLYKYK